MNVRDKPIDVQGALALAMFEWAAFPAALNACDFHSASHSADERTTASLGSTTLTEDPWATVATVGVWVGANIAATIDAIIGAPRAQRLYDRLRSE